MLISVTEAPVSYFFWARAWVESRERAVAAASSDSFLLVMNAYPRFLLVGDSWKNRSRSRQAVTRQGYRWVLAVRTGFLNADLGSFPLPFGAARQRTPAAAGMFTR